MKTKELERPATQANGKRAALVGALAATFRTIMWQGHKQTADTMESIGLTLPQAGVLMHLNAIGGRATMSDIARMTYQSAATATGVVDRLILAGLIDRERDE